MATTLPITPPAAPPPPLKKQALRQAPWREFSATRTAKQAVGLLAVVEPNVPLQLAGVR